MISTKTTTGVLGVQTFVFANGQLYKAGTQRMSDAVSGRRAEPALTSIAAKVWTASITDEGIEFGRGTTAVFDERGLARQDVYDWSMRARLDGLDEAEYVKKRLPQDALVMRFLEVSANVIDQLQLVELAQTAQILPTR